MYQLHECMYTWLSGIFNDTCLCSKLISWLCVSWACCPTLSDDVCILISIQSESNSSWYITFMSASRTLDLAPTQVGWWFQWILLVLQVYIVVVSSELMISLLEFCLFLVLVVFVRTKTGAILHQYNNLNLSASIIYVDKVSRLL